MNRFNLLFFAAISIAYTSCMSQGDIRAPVPSLAGHRDPSGHAQRHDLFAIFNLDSIPRLERFEDSTLFACDTTYRAGDRVDPSNHCILGPILAAVKFGELYPALVNAIRQDSELLARRYSRCTLIVTANSIWRALPPSYICALFNNDHEGRIYCVNSFDSVRNEVRQRSLRNVAGLNKALNDTLKSHLHLTSHGPNVAIIISTDGERRSVTAYSHDFAFDLYSRRSPDPYPSLIFLDEHDSMKIVNRKNLDRVVGMAFEAGGLIRKTIR